MNKYFLVIYLFTFCLCAATYILYPVLIWLFGKLLRFNVHRAKTAPLLSVIISAYNEERNIEQKIKNTLALEYPKDRMEILVGSDGSSDRTPGLIERYYDQGVQLIHFDTRRGKTAVQNELVERSKGEILIFTDAASFLNSNALQKITQNFADQRVGCVAGRMRFNGTNTNITTHSQGLYWCYESRLRQLESRLGSLIGVDGPLYAVRRDCYVPLAKNVISDLITPLLVLAQGKKVVLEPEAFVDEDPTRKTRHEFMTRRRITIRGLVGLSAHKELMNPFKNPMLAFQIILHKVLRWFVGPMIVVNVLACVALSQNSFFFTAVLITYFIFFAIATLGFFADRLGVNTRLLSVPYYFTLVNVSATFGIIDFLRGKQTITWQPIRH